MKTIEKDILVAIKNGYHRTTEILEVLGLELRYQDFCEAIGNLQIKKKIESRGGKGYYLVEKKKIYEVIFTDNTVSKFEKSSKEELEIFKRDIKVLRKEDCVNMELDLDLDKEKIIAGGTTELIRVFIITESNDPNKEVTKATCILNLNALYKTLNYVLE